MYISCVLLEELYSDSDDEPLEGLKDRLREEENTNGQHHDNVSQSVYVEPKRMKMTDAPPVERSKAEEWRPAPGVRGKPEIAQYVAESESSTSDMLNATFKVLHQYDHDDMYDNPDTDQQSMEQISMQGTVSGGWI